MTLRDFRKLQVGDKFRKPSTNSHDNGWREYRVAQIEFLLDPSKLITVTLIDQHNYLTRVRLSNWLTTGWKLAFSKAERVV